MAFRGFLQLFYKVLIRLLTILSKPRPRSSISRYDGYYECLSSVSDIHQITQTFILSTIPSIEDILWFLTIVFTLQSVGYDHKSEYLQDAQLNQLIDVFNHKICIKGMVT